MWKRASKFDHTSNLNFDTKAIKHDLPIIFFKVLACTNTCCNSNVCVHWLPIHVKCYIWECYPNVSGYTPLQRGNYHHIACSITPLPPWTYFTSENSIMTFCKAEAAVTHNLIGRKIISNVKHSDARNSLPILDVIRSSHKRHSALEYCKWTARQTTGVCYIRAGAPSHFPTEYRHEAAVVSQEHTVKWVVTIVYWEIVINDHCHGSVVSGVSVVIHIEITKFFCDIELTQISPSPAFHSSFRPSPQPTSPNLGILHFCLI